MNWDRDRQIKWWLNNWFLQFSNTNLVWLNSFQFVPVWHVWMVLKWNLQMCHIKSLAAAHRAELPVPDLHCEAFMMLRLFKQLRAPVWSLPVVSSSVEELEQEAPQVRRWSPACVCPGVCPGVCVWAGSWSRSLAVCCCIADWGSEVAGRTWLLTERCTTNRTAGTDGLTDRQAERQTGRQRDRERQTDSCDISQAELRFDLSSQFISMDQWIHSASLA